MADAFEDLYRKLGPNLQYLSGWYVVLLQFRPQTFAYPTHRLSWLKRRSHIVPCDSVNTLWISEGREFEPHSGHFLILYGIVNGNTLL